MIRLAEKCDMDALLPLIRSDRVNELTENARKGKKIGGGLMAATGTPARNAGCGSLMLQVSRQNRKGRAFYIDNGYHERTGFELLEKEL